MTKALRVGSGLSVLLCALALPTSARAEDVEKKVRLGLSVGGFDGADNAHSPSANVRTILRPDDVFLGVIRDPRNDSAAVSDFGLEPQFVGTFSASYAFNTHWYVEGSVGYRQGDVGNIEVQAQFFGQPTPPNQAFNFRIFNLNAGTFTQVPIQATAGIRFRPKASLNPYVCAGIGYTMNSFDPSTELDDLSRTLDNSTAGFARLNGPTFDAPTEFRELSGITVEAPDSAEWHVGGGIELTFKRRWVVFADARYLVYSNRFALHVNGDATELGISVPADAVRINEAGATGPFGPYLFQDGGLIDGGSLVPVPTAPPGTDCAIDPSACTLTGPADGLVDPGFYYVHAGSVRLDGVTFQLGVKFTF